MNAKLYQRCIDISRALKSHAHGKSTHTAFAVKKGKIIRIAQNDYRKAHPAHRFGVFENVKKFENDYFASLHSEISLAIRVGSDSLCEHEILVLRVSKTGVVGQSKPCINCARTLKALNCRTIYHSNDQGQLEKLKL